MLAWALIINNVGRRRYPLHWWAPGETFVRHDSDLEKAEEQREEIEEGDLERESTAAGSTEAEYRLPSREIGPDELQEGPKSLQSAIDASPGKFSDRK